MALIVYCQQTLLHEVLDFVRQMREAPPEESPQMGAQRFQKISIRSRVPAESEQKKPAEPIFVRAHAFLFSYSLHLGAWLQLGSAGRNDRSFV